MIVCPHCNHQNPEEAIQCEACYTPLPTTTNCPNCGAPVQTDATFCGQCGFNLIPEMTGDADDVPETIVTSSKNSANEQNEERVVAPTVQATPSIPPKLPVAAVNERDNDDATASVEHSFSSKGNSKPDPDAVIADPFSTTPDSSPDFSQPEPNLPALPTEVSKPPATEVSKPPAIEPQQNSEPLKLPDPPSKPLPPPPKTAPIASSFPPAPPDPSPSMASGGSTPTRLQLQTASLFHVQTQLRIELPFALSVIHLGKPNEQIPPDIDVSGYPDSEIVSRIHADIRVEGDNYFIEDTGSSNGTYINHTPLASGNRHRLRSGDRISLGKGDKVTFIFQLS
jgi:pSer/pThr/pTyr-binding forkhead associated (FHA) protein/ribosomal protein L40E